MERPVCLSCCGLKFSEPTQLLMFTCFLFRRSLENNGKRIFISIAKYTYTVLGTLLLRTVSLFAITSLAHIGVQFNFAARPSEKKKLTILSQNLEFQKRENKYKLWPFLFSVHRRCYCCCWFFIVFQPQRFILINYSREKDSDQNLRRAHTQRNICLIYLKQIIIKFIMYATVPHCSVSVFISSV